MQMYTRKHTHIHIPKLEREHWLHVLALAQNAISDTLREPVICMCVCVYV